MPESERAAVVQGDRSILVEVDHPGYERARGVLARFAEIEKTPEHVHTYRLSDLSLWNAASAGLGSDDVLRGLREVSRFELPGHLEHEVRDVMRRYGVCELRDHPTDRSRLHLVVQDAFVWQRLAAAPPGGAEPEPGAGAGIFVLPTAARGIIKQALLKLGYPVVDRAGIVPGEPLAVCLEERAFTPYDYQRRAAEAFLDAGAHGVVVLPCGAGKTVVAMIAMSAVATRTLVLTTGREACAQWRRELLAKTTLTPQQVGVYDTKSKEVAPVTVSTYSMLSRKGGAGPTGHVHFDRLAAGGWGLVVYDEVHLLPAPVFRLTADLQARRRLGLTATLVREDGRAGDVFALIGPKRYDVPWRELEKSGHIAEAVCIEVRVPLADGLRVDYANAGPKEQPRLAADNPDKVQVLRALLDEHQGDRVLVLGTYLELLRDCAKIARAPIITGETPHSERERLLAEFRSGANRTLFLSRVGNFALDLPEANVLIQLSGTMGSRQEEAQRLGRVLRPKPGGATFYTLVTRDTVEQQHALHRQLFLTEQGYRYYVRDSDGAAAREPLQH